MATSKRTGNNRKTKKRRVPWNMEAVLTKQDTNTENRKGSPEQCKYIFKNKQIQLKQCLI